MSSSNGWVIKRNRKSRARIVAAYHEKIMLKELERDIKRKLRKRKPLSRAARRHMVEKGNDAINQRRRRRGKSSKVVVIEEKSDEIIQSSSEDSFEDYVPQFQLSVAQKKKNMFQSVDHALYDYKHQLNLLDENEQKKFDKIQQILRNRQKKEKRKKREKERKRRIKQEEERKIKQEEERRLQEMERNRREQQEKEKRIMQERERRIWQEIAAVDAAKKKFHQMVARLDALPKDDLRRVGLEKEVQQKMQEINAEITRLKQTYIELQPDKSETSSCKDDSKSTKQNSQSVGASAQETNKGNNDREFIESSPLNLMKCLLLCFFGICTALVISRL